LHVGRKRADYDKAHIPGARYLATDDYVLGHAGAMTELPSVDALEDAFEKAGVNDDSRVIIYTPDWYPIAGRAYYTLDYLGHGDNAALLDGSIEQWIAEKRPLSTEAVAPAKGTFTPHVKENVRALIGEARRATEENPPSAILVDSRPQKRYTSGHLPGADHVFWEETVKNPDQPVFLSPDQLRRLFSSRGITPGHKLVTYCEVGLQASHMYFVAKYLGYDASMYDGSYYEWNEMQKLPVVKGSSAR